ncbi:hypothetical protein H2248_010874 [Termitomyces sp. 'cryptogamus']|nr:hypothetical protein H2248_010874 [Termitomyces sp. 'cryptogamus']
MPPRLIQANRFFGPGSFDWFDRSYVIDWIVVLFIWIISWIAEELPVYERSFDLNDPLISHPHGKDTVSSPLNHNIAFFVPAFISAFSGWIRSSVMEIHHGIIVVAAASGIAHLFTTLGKHALGRLRPDFLARCAWDDVVKQCTGQQSIILNGRKSFPSGHSSTAFSGMTALSFWIAGMTAAWCFSVPCPPRSLLSSRLGKFVLTLLPLSWAAFVAISRIQDYRHHKEDVIVGSLIGIFSATASYLIF